jgi:hypothetical protein
VYEESTIQSVPAGSSCEEPYSDDGFEADDAPSGGRAKWNMALTNEERLQNLAAIRLGDVEGQASS